MPVSLPVLTRRSASSLAASIRRGELSVAEVVQAHIEVHRRWQPRINALVADRFAEARAEAATLDARLQDGSAPSPEQAPLLGVPFTVKESIAVRGMPNSAGVVARSKHRPQLTATAVQRILAAGAVLLGVTNTSELTLWIESENHLYGRTANPFDEERTAGGSSGGEGAAVGCGGSPFGIGNDIAGSIRIPALFCGVFSHKGSAGVVPNTGSYPPPVGETGRMLQTGALARRAEDLLPLTRLMAGPDGSDPHARTVSFGDPAEVSFAGLRVVTVEDASTKAIAQPLRDARERAVGALAAAGAVPVSVKLPSWRRGLLPYLAALGGSGSEVGPTTAELLVAEGQPLPSAGALLTGRGVPHTRATRLVLLLESLGGGSRRGADRLLGAAEEMAAELTEAVGDGVMLHPAHATTAPSHGRTVGRPWLIMPAAVFNLAGLPVTEVPLGLSPDGLPVGVQVAAGRDQDHVSIAVALRLERVFGGWVPPTWS